jgi:hypothetical protein
MLLPHGQQQHICQRVVKGFIELRPRLRRNSREMTGRHPMTMRKLIAALLAVYCLSAAAGIIIIDTALTREREAAKSIAIDAETVGWGE